MAEYNKKLPVICVTGPTASGKSRLAVELAKKVNGEIINADSVQVYRGFDIGSGKSTEKEMAGIRHHLISHLDPSEQYSTGRFRKEANVVIKDILSRSKVPIVVGGTGLYVRSLFSEFMGIVNVEFSDQLFEKLRIELSKKQFENWCAKFLEIVDNDAFVKIGENDSVRIQRDLSLFLSMGIKNSLCRSILNQNDSKLCGLVFILEENRETLYAKIDQRVQEMWEKGWVEEVRKILEINNNIEPIKLAGLRSLGYRHIYSALCQDKTLETFDLLSLINTIQRDTRRFAKRQRTWWRHQPEGMGWLELQSIPEEITLLESSRNSGDQSTENNFSQTLNLITGISENFMASGINGFINSINSASELIESGNSEINVIFKRIFLH